MFLSWLMRLHLINPNGKIWGLHYLSAVGAPGDVMTPEYYLSLLTCTAPSWSSSSSPTPLCCLRQLLPPHPNRRRGHGLPRFNMMSFWTTFLAFCFLISAFFVPDGPPISGWTAYAPLSAVGSDAGPGLGMGQTLWASPSSPSASAPSSEPSTSSPPPRPAGQGHDALPHAHPLLGLVHHLLHRSARIRRLLPACLLLILDRVAGTSFFIPAAWSSATSSNPRRRLAPTLAAPLLVLRTP